ncbi:hypothetical protein Q3F64_10480 [Enterococcus faecium]|uniref:hypothetical protein n=1 Tax=Bacteria TaxID=2 RepID=UPI000A33A387|nr:hypothetical protein [Enterococcus faecium]EHA3992585.1 hypothetical protein [Enterococcus faecalis]EGP5101761.1 hypothetical protein [Enterococcus faecium]EHQ8827435.1 hypothetical protein [Enterococcus faecalis]MCD4947645.1 hypothetical protein [Enterococcus faecium]MDN3039264.1 hypothetical protein [Enterococcus faecium]
MKDTVTIIKSNLNYQQAIFSLLALNSLSNDYIGNQIFRENVQTIVEKTLENDGGELIIIETNSNDIEAIAYF